MFALLLAVVGRAQRKVKSSLHCQSLVLAVDLTNVIVGL